MLKCGAAPFAGSRPEEQQTQDFIWEEIKESFDSFFFFFLILKNPRPFELDIFE